MLERLPRIPRLLLVRLSPVLLSFVCLFFVGPAAAGDEATPAALSAPEVAIESSDAWRAAVSLERDAFGLIETDALAAGVAYAEASRRYQDLARTASGDPDPWWRAARCEWLGAEILPLEDKERRIAHFTRAEALAAEGLAAEADCAECMLWKFTSMGRLRTTRGLIAGLRGTGEMAALLERGIALAPTQRDSVDNSTLGNLHYSSAIFYRVVPDWVWLGWLLGVRGDKERALEHARTALALHPARLDFQVEVGSQLLCLGSAEDAPDRFAEGRRILTGLLGAPTHSIRDERQVQAAAIMLEAPEKSCGFTGDAWLEIDAREAAKVAGKSE
jgi:hypothetical protein